MLKKLGCSTHPPPEVECCIVHIGSFRKQQHSHHFAETLNDLLLQKLGCSTHPPPKVECRIVHHRSVRKQQHSRHFAEAVNGLSLQKLGCSTHPPPKVECCIVHVCSLRKQQHSHHFAEALNEKLLLTLSQTGEQLECYLHLGQKVFCWLLLFALVRPRSIRVADGHIPKTNSDLHGPRQAMIIMIHHDPKFVPFGSWM